MSALCLLAADCACWRSHAYERLHCRTSRTSTFPPSCARLVRGRAPLGVLDGYSHPQTLWTFSSGPLLEVPFPIRLCAAATRSSAAPVCQPYLEEDTRSNSVRVSSSK